MRRISVWLLCVVVAGVIASGCSRQRTVTTPGGQVTVTERGGKTQVTTTGPGGTGKVEITGGAGMSEQEIGIPFYPGAKVAQTVGWSGQEQQGKGEYKVVNLTTPDSVDQVKAFYQQKFTEAQTAIDMTADGGRTVQMALEKGGSHKMVTISRAKEATETTITLHRGESGK